MASDHAHERHCYELDSTSNFVEHPRLIAQRICRYADIVGRDRVIAGADCGFGAFATVLPRSPLE
jgi:5-methyltetrahydropteroyltriglutamate--homocysteine methyltransferase